MTVFLILIVLGLLAITIWQISKIFQLSRSKKSESHPGVSDWRDNRIQGYLLLAFGILFYAFMIFNFWEYSKLYPPKAASAEGMYYDTLFFTTAIVIIRVRVVIKALIFYFSYKYYGSIGQVAKFLPDNERLEYACSII